MGIGLATLITALLAGAFAGTGTASGSISQGNANARNAQLKAQLRSQYPELSETQLDALIAQYGDVGGGFFDASKWGDQTDREAINRMLADIDSAYADLGYAPEMPTEAELDKIMQDANSEIDSENNRLLNMYKDSLDESKELLSNEMANNAAMFSDYRNQTLTNEAVRQQAIAGSTRFELDRQQRNAISRGASAAQRLVSNINTSLGLQAQSAQQALETSNALAQNLLNYRQAQQGVRDSYLNSRNAYTSQVANTLSGQAERRLNYSNAKRQEALDKYNYAYDAWNERVANKFQGNSLGEGIYRSRYGNGKRNAI